MTKFIVKRTSLGWHDDVKPCEEAKEESVTSYDCRTLPVKSMQKKFPDADFSDFEDYTFKSGIKGCRRVFYKNVYTIEIDSFEELMSFIKKYGAVVILSKSLDCDLQTIEIYDSWRE